MASSGSFTNLYSSDNGYMKLALGWFVEERSMEDNTSTIGIWTVLNPQISVQTLNFTYSITIGPQTQSKSSFSSMGSVSAGSSYAIIGTDMGNQRIATVVVPHNADGTKLLDISFEFYFVPGGTIEYSATVELDPFERYSTVTASNGVIGSTQVTITIDTATSGRRHKITYAFGSLTGTISSGTTSTSLKWTLPTSFYNQMSEVVSKTGTITISYTIGENTYTD